MTTSRRGRCKEGNDIGVRQRPASSKTAREIRNRRVAVLRVWAALICSRKPRRSRKTATAICVSGGVPALTNRFLESEESFISIPVCLQSCSAAHQQHEVSERKCTNYVDQLASPEVPIWRVSKGCFSAIRTFPDSRLPAKDAVAKPGGHQ